MSTRTRYFIYAHEAAFNDCRLEGLAWRDGALHTDGTAQPAVLITPVLDSLESGNVWQRVLADIDAKSGAHVVWRLYASDIEHIPSHGENAFVIENTGDFIPVGLRGRYIRLEALIYGSASIRSLMIYQSWESLLDCLPEIYRDYDSFSDRFLRIFAAQYFELERRIDEFPGTLDPAVAPEGTLRYMAGLAGVAHISLWSCEGLRKLLTHGIYRRHGQFSVFADYIEYFTGYKPHVAEHFRYVNGIRENDCMYTDADISVFMPPDAAGLDMEALKTVIDDFLPCDVVCRIVMLDTFPVISGGAILGVNTRMGSYEQMAVGTARVGVTLIGGDL